MFSPALSRAVIDRNPWSRRGGGNRGLSKDCWNCWTGWAGATGQGHLWASDLYCRWKLASLSNHNGRGCLSACGRRLWLSLCFLYYSPTAGQAAIARYWIHRGGGETISHSRGTGINFNFSNYHQLRTRSLRWTPIGRTIVCPGWSGCALDSHSLCLPNRINAQGDQSDSGNPQRFTLPRFTLATFPPRCSQSHESTLARSSQWFYYSPYQRCHPRCRPKNHLHCWFSGRNRSSFWAFNRFCPTAWIWSCGSLYLLPRRRNARLPFT